MHKRIWLQSSDEHNEETWCQNRINDDDVEYIRADINAALLDVVRDCVNFLADLNSTSPFDSEYMVQRAKALHKRAYTAHSKAKSHADTLKGD